jgi:hypothetical protein
LEALHSITETPPHYAPRATDRSVAISFHPALLWELLDSTCRGDTQLNFASPTSTARETNDQGASSQIHVTTQFAYPPAGDRDIDIASSDLALNEQSRIPEIPNLLMDDLEPVLLDDLFPVFPDYGIDWNNDGYTI